MLARTLLLTLALLASPAAYCLDRQDITDDTLRSFARQLAAHAANFQWQQLWQQARSSGRFKTSGAQPRFTLAPQELPTLARQLLAAPDRLERLHPGQAVLRRDFAPKEIGLVANRPTSELCLTLRWDWLEGDSPSNSLKLPSQGRLTVIEPC